MATGSRCERHGRPRLGSGDGRRTKWCEGQGWRQQLVRAASSPRLGVGEHDTAPRALVEVRRKNRSSCVPGDDAPIARLAAHEAAVGESVRGHDLYVYTALTDERCLVRATFQAHAGEQESSWAQHPAQDPDFARMVEATIYPLGRKHFHSIVFG